MAGRLRIFAIATLGTALVVALSIAAVALASERVAPLSEAPTATVLADDAPLGEQFRDVFVGEEGIYDPAAGLVTPDEVAFDIEIQAAHNGHEIFFRYEVPTPKPAFYNLYSVYRDGEWIAVGGSAIGPEPHGLDEDRIAMLIDDGSVKGFSNQGGWLTCHEDLRGHSGLDIMPSAAENEDVAAHPVLGEVYGRGQTLKYIPQSRDTGPDWWGQFDGWDAMSPENVDAYQQRQEAGVFLDVWFWRAHNTGPIGYATNQYVFESRSGSPGSPPRRMNWDGEAGQPSFMFDPDVAGYRAMDWDAVQRGEYGWDDHFYLADGVNAVAFDPDYPWQDGDTIPRLRLEPPEETRGTIRSAASLVPDGDGWRWQVEMWRAMDTGQPLSDKVMTPGRTYDAAIAVHRMATGTRWHFVTMPFAIGIDINADVTAARFDGDRPDWDTIPSTTLTAMYPGQTSWQRVSERHPGGAEIRADTMSIAGCHDDPVGLAAAMRAKEPAWAGIADRVEQPTTLVASVFDPGNAAFIFLIIALATILGAIALGRSPKGRRNPESRT